MKTEKIVAQQCLLVVTMAICGCDSGGSAPQQMGAPAAMNSADAAPKPSKAGTKPAEPAIKHVEAAPMQTDAALPKAVKDIASEKPQFTVTVKHFHDEYEQDKKAADAKYRPAIVQLSGYVQSFGLSSEGDAWLSIAPTYPGVRTVGCWFKEPEPWTRATPGQTITIKGRGYREGMTSACLSDCVIVEVSGPTAAKATSEELIKAFRTDAKAAQTKYGAKTEYDDLYLIVTGDVVKKDLEKHSLFLKGMEGTTLMCEMSSFADDALEKLPVDKPVTLIGKIVVDKEKNEIKIVFGELITKNS